MYLEPSVSEINAACEAAEADSRIGDKKGSLVRSRVENQRAGASPQGRFPKVDDILDRVNRRTVVTDRC